MKLAEIEVTKLHRSESNPRVNLNVEDLVHSVQSFGIMQPLVVRKHQGGYEIIAGHRRHAAALLAGLKKVPCVVRGDRGDISAQHLIENILREDLKPYEIAQAIGQALKAKVKQKTLAAQLGKSETWISKYATIAKALKKVGVVMEPEQFKISNGETSSVPKGEIEEIDSRIFTTDWRLIGDDAEQVYQAARSVLGLDKKETQETLPIDQDHNAGGAAGDDQEAHPGELDEIEQLKAQAETWYRDALFATGAKVRGKVTVVPFGLKGYTAAIEFKDADQLRDTLKPQPRQSL